MTALVGILLLAACTIPSPARTLSAAVSLAPPTHLAQPSGVTRVETTSPGPQTCTPTHDDGVSPSYKPDMPERSMVGKGHILRGTVRSSHDCAPIAGAKIELWPEYAGHGHPDAARATVYADENGTYTFECDPPEHIHMRITADGYRTIGNNSYHPDGAVEGQFDIVLQPEVEK